MAADRHTYRITGGVPLRGTVEASGAKNAVTKELVATLLTDEPCTLHGVPRILEVDLVLGMLAELGTEVTWLGEHTVRVHTPKVANTSLSSAYSGVNRIPILMMGPLLHRRGETVVPLPGGCTIGKRPIDFHLEGLHQMGADIVDRPGSVKVTATRLTGAHVHLPFPSVGATENLLLAAALAKGTTVISNAAVEPEIVDLVLMLQKMGALITIDTDRTLTISGVDELRGVEHTTVADRIEIASFAAAAVATDGRIEVRGARQDHLITFLNALRHIGGEFTETENGLEFFRGRPLTATDIETGVHPGFMTDWQQPITVLLTQATGTSVVHETIYEDRFGYAEQLSRAMGAEIELTTRCLGASACRWHNRDFLHTAKISGPSKLKAADLTIPDLRAGFGYVLAALVADGTSTISGTRYLERGYEEPVAKLAAVGYREESFFKFNFVLGKCQDTMSPVGPALVPRQFLDGSRVDFSLWVNGTRKQAGNTADMIYSLPEQIAGVSRAVTIEPGDMMFTGSPAGVGLPRGEKLASGDVIRIEADAVGAMEVVVQ